VVFHGRHEATMAILRSCIGSGMCNAGLKRPRLI
jgi:hypothetical protein